MDRITQILENVVRCKYFNLKHSYQDGLGNTTQTLEHVVVVHILFETRESLKLTNIVMEFMGLHI
jgi:hypothetical protein